MYRIFTAPNPLDPTRPFGFQYPGAEQSVADEMAAVGKFAVLMDAQGRRTHDRAICDGADLMAAMASDERLFRTVHAVGGTLKLSVALGARL